MGDMGDHFNDVRKAGQEKRASNREQSALMLKNEGIPFETKNHGAHLIVAERVDFWPGTGKWIFREKGGRGYGVRNLINALVDAS